MDTPTEYVPNRYCPTCGSRAIIKRTHFNYIVCERHGHYIPNAFYWDESSPQESGYKFCPKCGKPIEYNVFKEEAKE